MREDRLKQIEAQWLPNVGPPLNGRQTVLELVAEVRDYQQHNLTAMHEYRVQVRRAEKAEAEVRRLRDGCTCGVADDAS